MVCSHNEGEIAGPLDLYHTLVIFSDSNGSQLVLCASANWLVKLMGTGERVSPRVQSPVFFRLPLPQP